jgi:CRISPR-associated protein Csb2
MPATPDMPADVDASAGMLASGALAISLEFPRGIYSGAVLGRAEELPEHSRVHEAFVAAAAGGPTARTEGNVLVATDEHRRAVEWLEDNEPLGLIAPAARMTPRSARRYRWRASPVAPNDTDFEPCSALAGPVVYLWPPVPDDVLTALREIAPEVTHVGRADSVVLVDVDRRDVASGPSVHIRAEGRGTGRVMRVARPGRFDALARAHVQTSRPGRHGTGSLGRQAADQLAPVNEEALELRRFEPTDAAAAWPFSEVWELPLDGTPDVLAALTQPANRVAAAVGIHKALVRRIGDSVPAFVSGRAGDGPLQGAGHLAIHVAPSPQRDALVAYLAIPAGTLAADREQLASAVSSSLRAGASMRRGDTRWFGVDPPSRRHAAGTFWLEPATTFQTAIPMVLEINGGPRRGAWTLDDAVVCSVGFAMRGVLEREGLTWETGWAFRAELVRRLREEHGVDARTSRVRRDTLRFVHRVREGELVVATHALVDLGTLGSPSAAGFLALGRARHLGGGLLIPTGMPS